MLASKTVTGITAMGLLLNSISQFRNVTRLTGSASIKGRMRQSLCSRSPSSVKDAATSTRCCKLPIARHMHRRLHPTAAVYGHPSMRIHSSVVFCSTKGSHRRMWHAARISYTLRISMGVDVEYQLLITSMIALRHPRDTLHIPMTVRSALLGRGGTWSDRPASICIVAVRGIALVTSSWSTVSHCM